MAQLSNPNENVPSTVKLNGKLKFRLRIYAAVSVVILGIVIWRVIQGTLDIPTVLVTVGVGLLAGWLFSRIYRVDVDEATGEVTGVMDAIGIALLVVYLAVSLSRGLVIEQWVHDAHRASAVSLAFTGAVMAGRVIFSVRRIHLMLAALGLPPLRSRGK